MRILHVLPSMELGGGPQHVLDLATALRPFGFDSAVAGPPGPMRRQFAASGIRLVEPTHRRGFLLDGAPYQPDLIHTHGKMPGLMRLTPGMGPFVQTFHGLHYRQYGPLKRRLYCALERFLARRTAAIIHLTEGQRLEALQVGLPDGTVIPNGIAVDDVAAAALPRAVARRMLDLPQDAYVMGTIARLDPVKGIETLIEALRGLDHDVRLVVIGDGADRAQLERLADGLACRHRVRFVGAVPHAARFLRAFDVYVSASTCEGLPLSVLEAMACGLPCAVSDIPGHAALVPKMQRLAPDNSAQSLVSDVMRYRRWPALAKEYGIRNAAAAGAFSAEKMAAATNAVYRAALGVTVRTRFDVALEQAMTPMVQRRGPTKAYHAWWERA